MGNSSAALRHGHIQPNQPRLLFLFMRSDRPSLAEKSLADLSFPQGKDAEPENAGPSVRDFGTERATDRGYPEVKVGLAAPPDCVNGASGLPLRHGAP